MLQTVYNAFGLTEDPAEAVAFGSGLINHTWKIQQNGKYFVLQRINENVFRDPEAIAFNIDLTANYLSRHHPEYLFVTPVESTHRSGLFHDKEAGYFRLSPFVEGSHTIDVVEKPEQAFEAAKQFGLFTRLLGGLDVSRLQTTIPDFHNLSLRYEQFERALSAGNGQRIDESRQLITRVISHKSIVDTYEKLKKSAGFRLRATHHDTKISNVLFDPNDKGLCVIDLDTLMPGYFISDLGDMMRTYLSPVSEEETDLSAIRIRHVFFRAIIEGYLGEMKNELTDEEKSHVVYAGKFMIYMQAIRFLTDHLNNDIYYGARYEGHNYNRAANQLELLALLVKEENNLEKMVGEFIS